MKIILSALEFGRLSDLSSNVSITINNIDSECIMAPPLIETLKKDLPSFTVLNVLPDGSVELEYSEEYCLDTFELVEKSAIKLLPILYRLEPVMEKFSDAFRSLIGVFDNGFVASVKDWFTDTKDMFADLAEKYM